MLIKGEKVSMSIRILDRFGKLINIISGIINIAKELKSYINGMKNSKKDPSSSPTAPDGSNDD